MVELASFVFARRLSRTRAKALELPSRLRMRILPHWSRIRNGPQTSTAGSISDIELGGQ